MTEANVAAAAPPDRTRVLVTGASGFVGRALVARLAAEGRPLRLALRRPIAGLAAEIDQRPIGDIGAATVWREVLGDIAVIVHAAARVHVMRDPSADPLRAFREVNVEGTLRLARDAAGAGVRRLIFLSSIKVNGEETRDGHRFRADDPPAPADPYGVSKCEAEEGLRGVAQHTGLEVVIIRAPLVYGPGVKANFANLVRLVQRGVPLPLGAIHNRRTLVALGNLVDLIVTCIDHPAAANQTFLAGDAEDLSTTDLLKRLGQALGRPARLVPVPARLVQIAARLLGQQAVAQRLCGSLQLDISKASTVLGWRPPLGVDAGLRRVAASFLTDR